jgi:glyoxylase-like metal-dependent hydrolase (beta-lactamase superfamily II)
MLRTPRYSLHAIDTQSFTLDGGAMFGVVPRVLWERKIPPDERNGIRLAMRALLIRGEGRTVLVDCGMGDGWDATWLERYSVRPALTRLEANLARHGVSRADVTDVIVTHLHFDHTGGIAHPRPGLTVARTAADLEPTFPRARHHVQRTHLEHGLRPNPKDRASFVQERILPVLDAGLFTLHDGPAEPLPGLRLIPVQGHSEGMQLVRLDDGDLSLLYCADLVPTSAHLPVAWVMAYDNQPLVTLDEKSTLVVPFSRAGGVLFFEHDPALAAGRFSWEGGKPALLEALDLQ